MPRTAVATPPATLDQLLDRGRAQGHLSLAELRDAFAQAGISPVQGRSILRELTEAGVSLAAEDEPSLGKPARRTPRKTAQATQTAQPAQAVRTAAKATGSTTSTKRAAAADAALARTDRTPDLPTDPTADSTAGLSTDRTPAEPREAVQAVVPEAATSPDSEPDGPVLVAEDAGADTAADTVADTDVDADEVLDLDDNQSVMGDSVHTYLKSIGRRTLLTAAQEVELARRIEAGLYAEYKLETDAALSPAARDDLEMVVRDGKEAKDHMLEANLRLVVSVAKKYTDRGMSLLDVVQEGNLGLIRAVEKFDYTKGFKFSTYAMWWIRQAIQRGFADSARTIRLPVHVLEMLSKLSRIERDMHQRLGREPTPEELAVELDRTPDQIEELLRTSRQPISLNATIGEDGETTIGDLIEDVDSPEASEIVDRQLLGDQLRGVLENLSPRESKIMALRFGLVDGKPHTLDEIGKHLGLTRERIRQLEKESLSKLRHPSNTRPLLDWAS
ncbi:RNA polymerase sigma factor [Nonomuraea sp. NPDC047897]|uniref:RNA polymerase sigma factor n=1 Tax=Nonomuraea sp. NPDC047897 TaxID=3364346 RepID=UPI003721A327